MGRIPIYTSRAPMRTGPVVMPHPKMGTEVSEAIGGFARTVGKVAEDWATKKAQVEAQAEYANNTLLYKQAVNNNITVQSEDASIDPDDLIPNYKKSMQEASGSLVWNSKLAQRQFELNKGNFDLAAEQKLNVLGRNRFIANIKAGYEISRKAAVDSGKLEDGLLALQAIKSAFTPKQYKAEEIDLIHDVEYAQAERALALDIKADLSELKNITKKEKTALTKAAATIKHNEEVIFEKYIGEQQLKNGYDLFTKSDTGTISQAEITELLDKKEISEETAELLVKPQKADAETVDKVWNGFDDKIETVGDKYKDRIALQNAIIKSHRIDGELDFKDAQRLVNKIASPQSKSKINDFTIAKNYLKGELSVEDAERATRLLDEEIKGGLTGEAIVDRAKKMSDFVKVKDVKWRWDNFIDIFLPKSWEATREERETEWLKEKVEVREAKKLEIREAIKGKSTEKVKKIITETKAKVKVGKVRVVSPDGREGYIPEAQLEEAKKAGYKAVE